MENITYTSEYCHIAIIPELDTLREIWKIMNCPLDTFREICLKILEECKEHKIRNLVIDTGDAVSYLPRDHQEWLDKEFNRRILYETNVSVILLISPESLVTKISADKFFEHISRSDHGIITLKFPNYPDALRWIKARADQAGKGK
jgi:hypothetical protein